MNNCSRCDYLRNAGQGRTIGDECVIYGISGMYLNFCWKCAGFIYTQKGDVRDGFVLNRQINITDGSPFVSGTDPRIIADWLEERGKNEAASFMRSRA